MTLKSPVVASKIDDDELRSALDVLEDCQGNVCRASLERVLLARQRAEHGVRKVPASAPRSWRQRAPFWALLATALVPLAVRAQNGMSAGAGSASDISRSSDQILPHDWLFSTAQHGRRAQDDNATCASPCILPSACGAEPAAEDAVEEPVVDPNALLPSPDPAAAAAEEGEDEGEAPAPAADPEAEAAAPTEDVVDAFATNTQGLLLLLFGILVGVPFLLTVGFVYFFCIKTP